MDLNKSSKVLNSTMTLIQIVRKNIADLRD